MRRKEECGRSMVGLSEKDPNSEENGVNHIPHVDLLLCRFSTERIVAWNIFRLCTWVSPGEQEDKGV